jgi:hypothetical protein
LSNATINFGFQPRPRGRELIDLWRRVLFNAENGPACPCHGIVSGRVDPDSIETNMLAPLRTQYRDAGLKDLSEFIERRMRKSPFAGLREPFDAWLTALAEAKLPDELRKRLHDDLKASLTYHAEQQVEFVCD